MTQELRLILTQACNYNCYFCHHEGIKGIKGNALDSDDLSYLYSIANKYLDVKSVTLTGGEPLLLNNIEEIAEKLYSIGCNITIVTNGSLLKERMGVGKYIKKLNISLHSLDKEEYETIVGKENTFDTVIENIKEFRRLYPDVEINLNYALIKAPDIYEKVLPIVKFAHDNSVNVKFIELFPKTSEDYIEMEKLQEEFIKNDHDFIDSGNIKSKYSNGENSYLYTTKCLCSRSLDFDSPSEFCHNNNDLFISQDGIINLCRVKSDSIDILDEIKSRNDQELAIKLEMAFSKLGEECPYEKIKIKNKNNNYHQ